MSQCCTVWDTHPAPAHLLLQLHSHHLNSSVQRLWCVHVWQEVKKQNSSGLVVNIIKQCFLKAFYLITFLLVLLSNDTAPVFTFIITQNVSNKHFDIEYFIFTNIPTEGAIQVTLQKVEVDPCLADRMTLTPTQIADLLEFILRSIYFQYNLQTDEPRNEKAGQRQEELYMLTYPGSPPDSMWLAVVTSSDHTSYCHLTNPNTPLWTLPMCTPTLMFRLTPVASRTLL